MRTPKFTAKRAIGLAAAAALAVAGTVTFASSSQAAAQSLKLSYSTGGETAGRILSVTGKGFENAAGVNQVARSSSRPLLAPIPRLPISYWPLTSTMCRPPTSL